MRNLVLQNRKCLYFYLLVTCSFCYLLATFVRHSQETQQRLNSLKEQLKEKEEQVVNLSGNLRQTEELKDDLQRQYLSEVEQHLRHFQDHLKEREAAEAKLLEQLREQEEHNENSEGQLREIEQQLRVKHEQEENLKSQLNDMEQQLRERSAQGENFRSQLGEMEQQLREMERLLRQTEERLSNSQEKLQERDLREADLHEQLREKHQEQENSQRQLTEMEQQLISCQEQLQEKDLREADLHEQLREKHQEQENSQRQLTEMEQQLISCQEQLQERDLREADLHEQLREKEQEQENSQRQLTEREQQLTDCVRQIREKEEERASLEGQLGVKDQELNELETSLAATRQTISEYRRQGTCDWVISRNEIQITDKCLGRGGWGSVYEGKYCGCAVAVKQIYEVILSPHNIRLFEREMNIASRCRHPCLLQFIGAANDEGSPLFVTELMETSLRALLEQRELSETEITVISLDVARALNYLHQKKPSPIIHRDVSSANVLLWRQGDQYRAKVSDYGTANFMQQTMTVAPGNVIYSAPEVLTSNQTDKVSY